MSKKKIYWRVAEQPTGPYRSFFKRGWPTAYADKDCKTILFSLGCNDDYTADCARGLQAHQPLILHVARYDANCSVGRFKWLTFKEKHATLSSAKEFAEYFYNTPAYARKYARGRTNE